MNGLPAIIGRDMAFQPAELTSAIIQCLAATPHALGQRIRPELELCEITGLGRWQLRGALSGLVKQGILARRRGSGTFVARIPSKPPEQLRHTRGLSPDQLLAFDEAPEPVTTIARGHPRNRLQLELWSEWASSNRSQQAILAGMIEHANKTGHLIGAHSILRPDGSALTAQQVVDSVNASDCDGAIFGLNFYQDNRSAFASCKKPFVLHYTGSTSPGDLPLISLDSEGAIVHAVRLLADAGYENIALLGLDTKYHSAKHEHLAFERATELAGVNNAGFFGCDYLDISSCFAAANALLSSKADAVFVGDDVVLSIVSGIFEASRLAVGRRFGVITLSNRGVQLPGWCDWSRFELDGWLFGRMIVDALSIHIESGQARSPLLQIQLNWIAGSSHLHST